MRDTSARRHPQRRGKVVNRAVGVDRAADSTPHVVVRNIELTPDMAISQRLATKHGLMTLEQFSERTGVNYERLRALVYQHRTGPHAFPQRKARLGRESLGTPYLYDPLEVARWLELRATKWKTGLNWRQS